MALAAPKACTNSARPPSLITRTRLAATGAGMRAGSVLRHNFISDSFFALFLFTGSVSTLLTNARASGRKSAMWRLEAHPSCTVAAPVHGLFYPLRPVLQGPFRLIVR